MTDYRLLLVWISVFLGCGSGDLPPLAPVSGVVTLDGQPLPNKEIIFAPENGRPSHGATDENGVYELKYTVDVKGAIIGQHKVTISTPPPDDGDVSTFQEPIPTRYNSATQLTAEVKSGRNKLDFDLKSGG